MNFSLNIAPLIEWATSKRVCCLFLSYRIWLCSQLRSSNCLLCNLLPSFFFSLFFSASLGCILGPPRFSGKINGHPKIRQDNLVHVNVWERIFMQALCLHDWCCVYRVCPMWTSHRKLLPSILMVHSPARRPFVSWVTMHIYAHTCAARWVRFNLQSFQIDTSLSLHTHRHIINELNEYGLSHFLSFLV